MNLADVPVTVILLLVSASLATRGGDDEDKVEIVDPEHEDQTILVKEKYPGANVWLEQVASVEKQMRAEGKIDAAGHLIKN
jgi:hypothetical protein